MAIFNSYVTNYYQRVANLIKPNLGDRDYSAGCANQSGSAWPGINQKKLTSLDGIHREIPWVF